MHRMFKVIAFRTAATLALSGVGVALPATVSAADVGPSPHAAAVASPRPTPNGDLLAALKQRCDAAVKSRLSDLGVRLTLVNNSQSLTSADRAALQSQIAADEQGLITLDATIQADTTYAGAKTDCQTIVTGYRVYALEDPKIHEVIAADALTKLDATFTTLEPRLQTDINNYTGSAANKSAAQVALNSLESKVSASHTSISGVVSSVINLTASGYPGNQVVLKSADQNIKTSRTDLKGARDNVADIVRDLSH